MQSKAWSQRELMLSWKQCKSLGYSNKETVQRGPIFLQLCRDPRWDFLRADMENLKRESGVGLGTRGLCGWEHFPDLMGQGDGPIKLPRCPGCSPCPVSLPLGTLLWQPTWAVQTHPTCFSCPIGFYLPATRLTPTCAQFPYPAAQEPVKPPKH